MTASASIRRMSTAASTAGHYDGKEGKQGKRMHDI
jgi:hypothetical protein